MTDSQYLEDLQIPDEVKSLPNLKGYGTTPSLHQAMALDPGGRLQTLMEQFMGCADPLQARTMVWDIIFAWTGVTDADPGSRGNSIGDARKLLAFEKLVGQVFTPVLTASTPGGNESQGFQSVFSKCESEFSSYLMLSTYYHKMVLDASAAVEGLTSREAVLQALELTLLYQKLREIYSSGLESDRLVLMDFLTTLNAHDSRAIAGCQVIRSALHGTTAYDRDEFWQFMIGYFMTEQTGTACAGGNWYNSQNVIIRLKATGETLTIKHGLLYEGGGTVMEWAELAGSGLLMV